MEVYAVGGAVRDELLGLAVEDRDYVVVGATPETMIGLGYKPVGRDFPVFLHPVTKHEYALARTERKTAPGYAGFVVHAAPEVTLEDDLARRDLTINAIARDSAGRIIDPHGGVADLRAGCLRHVGPAFVEDPVRVLRVARFAARYGFSVAPETAALMRRMALSGEVDALVPERVWQELARGLMEPAPRRMFAVLDDCGALERILPEWRSLAAARALDALDAAAARGLGLAERFAALFVFAVPDLAEQASMRLRVSADCRELAVLAARWRAAMAGANTMDAAALVELLQRLDAFRRPDRFETLLAVYECAGAGDSAGFGRLRRAAAAARSVDAGAAAQAGPDDAAAAVRAARVAAVEAALRQAP